MVEVSKPDRFPVVDGRSYIASSLGFTTGVRGRPLFSILTNFESIRDNLRNILFFRKGEYLDDMDFGVGLQDFLFDNVGEQFNLPLSQEIRRQIGKYERRAIVRQLNVFNPKWATDTVIIDMELLIAGSLFQGNATAEGGFTLIQSST